MTCDPFLWCNVGLQSRGDKPRRWCFGNSCHTPSNSYARQSTANYPSNSLGSRSACGNRASRADIDASAFWEASCVLSCPRFWILFLKKFNCSHFFLLYSVNECWWWTFGFPASAFDGELENFGFILASCASELRSRTCNSSLGCRYKSGSGLGGQPSHH